MEYLSDFDNQIDWNIYEKEEKALPSSITDNKYLLKGYIVKEKGKDIYSLIRIFKISKDAIRNFDEISKVLTCPDFDEASGFLPFKKIEKFSINNDIFVKVINAFQDLVPLQDVENLSDSQKNKIIIRIVHSMSSLHDHGIIFETFNPKKILITPTFEPLLFDFGLDKLIVSEDQMKDNDDTIYFSPEILTKFENDKSKITNITTKTDVFSFGIVLYEFLSGQKMNESLVIPLEFKNQTYIWVINSSLNKNYKDRPTFSGIEQYLIKVLPLKEDQDLNNYLKNNKITKEEHFEIKERSILNRILKFSVIYIILKKVFEFNLSYFLLFVIDILIFIFSHPNVQLIIGA